METNYQASDYKKHRYWVDENGEVWEVIAVFDMPSVTLRSLDSDEELNGGIGSPILKEFAPLSPHGKKKWP